MQSTPSSSQALFLRLARREHFSDLLTACSISKSQFLAEYMPVAERLALCIQDLPLSPDVFKAPGGALQSGLQAGLLAVKSCDATIFEPKATAQERQKNDPLYRWCAYCSTLATIYLICAGQVEVILESGEIYSFASATPLGSIDGSFQARWRESPSQPSQAGLIFLQAFFHPGQFQHLPTDMLAMMAGAINPELATRTTETPLGRVVRTSITTVIEAQRQRDAAVIQQVAPAEMVDLPAHAAVPSGARPVDPLKPSEAAPTRSPAHVADGAAPAASAAKDPDVLIAPKVLEWVRALANIRSMDDEITVDDKGIQFSRKALGFGATPKENYAALYEAKVVLDKGADFARCNRMLAKVYVDEKAKATGSSS